MLVDAALSRERDGRGSRRGGGAGKRQLQVARQPDIAPLSINLGMLVERVEFVQQSAGAFTRAEEQKPSGLQREVEEREHRLLRVRLKVDQQVAARDQIQLGERRIANEVVRGEHDALAQRLGDLVALGLERKKPLQPFGADAVHLVGGVDAGARRLQRRLVHVGRQDLHVHRSTTDAQALVQQHGNRVRLLAGRASRYPHPNLIVGISALDDLRDDSVLECIECGVVAEKTRDADQQILVQRAQLARIAAQLLDVHIDIQRSIEPEAPFDPAGDGAGLVVREVDRIFVPKQAENRLDAALFGGRPRRQRSSVDGRQRRHRRRG